MEENNINTNNIYNLKSKVLAKNLFVGVTLGACLFPNSYYPDPIPIFKSGQFYRDKLPEPFFSDPQKQAKMALESALTEASEDGIVINKKSLKNARILIAGITDDFPLPDFCLTEDGTVSVEWYKSKTDGIYGLVGDDGLLHFAAVIDSISLRSALTIDVKKIADRIFLDTLHRIMS